MTEAEWEAGGDPAALLSTLTNLAAENGEVVSFRKRRLLACACANRIRHLLQNSDSERAIDAAERYADGEIDRATLAGFEQAARAASARAVRKAHSVWAQLPAALVARAAWVEVWAACAAENTCDQFAADKGEPAAQETGFQGCLAVRTAQVASWARSIADELTGAAADEETTTETALFFSFLRGLKTTVQRIEQSVKDGLETCETVCQARLVREIFGNPFHPLHFCPEWRGVNDGLVIKIAAAIYQDRSWEDMPILADALQDAGCVSTHLLGHLRGPGPHVRGCQVLDQILGKE